MTGTTGIKLAGLFAMNESGISQSSSKVAATLRAPEQLSVAYSVLGELAGKLLVYGFVTGNKPEPGREIQGFIGSEFSWYLFGRRR